MRRVEPGEAALAFVRFFDWDELVERSFEFIEVAIERFETKPYLVGRRALIRIERTRYVYSDAAGTS